MTNVFWVEALPWDPAANADAVVRATSADLSIATRMGGGLEWLPVIDGGPIFSTTAFSGTFTGKADTTRGQLNLLTGLGEIDDWARAEWPGRIVRIYAARLITDDVISPTLTPVELLFDGQAESYDPNDATLFLRTKTPVGLLASETFKGTGGLEGAPDMVNVKKPISLGLQSNRPATVMNSGSQLFRVNPGGRLESLARIREGGIPLDQPFVYHDTFDKLAAATVPPTEIHAHLASGSFRLGFEPVADISADFEGALKGGVYPENLIDMVRTLLAASGWDMTKIDEPSMAAVASVMSDPVQFHDDGSTDIADALTTLLFGAGGYWDVDQLGTFYVGLMQKADREDFSIGDEGSAGYDLLEVDFLPTRAPYFRNRLAYGENPQVVTFSDQPTGLTDDQRALLESVQDLTDGQVDVFFQSQPPATAADRDLWRDSDDGVWYKRDGGQWIPTPGLGALGEALVAAAGAQATADGKVTTFYQAAQPVAKAVGDLWIIPGKVPREVRTWTGKAWDVVSTLGADLATTIIDSGSASPTAIVPRTEIRTPLGTASAIQGQGKFATVDSAALGSALLTGFGALAGFAGIKTQPPYEGRQDFAAIVTSIGDFMTDVLYRTGLGTAASIFGQGWGATANRTLLDNAYVPVGQNVLVNSNFARGTFAFRADGELPLARFDDQFAEYSGRVKTLCLQMVNSGEGKSKDVTSLSPWYSPDPVGDMRKYCVPVKQGDRIAARAMVTTHRCNATLFILTFDRNGALVEAPGVNTGFTRDGGYNGENLGEMSVIYDVANPNSAYACWMLRATATTEADPYMFFGQPWLGKLNAGQTVIPPYTPGPADPISDRTRDNTAGGILGQGAFATLSSVGLGSPLLTGFGAIAAYQYGKLGASTASGAGLVTENGFGTSDYLLITDQGNAAGFRGQTAFATLPYGTSLDNGIFGMPGRLGGSPQHGAGFLKADAVAFSAGNTIEDLRPGERGANITEGRTAAAIVGQSAFATAQSVGYGSPLLTGFNQLAAAAFVQFGASRTVVTQDGTTVTDSVAVTAIGVASAITGQGAFATLSSVGLGSPLLTGFGAIAAYQYGKLGASTASGAGLVTENGFGTSDYLLITDQGNAAGFRGQTAFATLPYGTSLDNGIFGMPGRLGGSPQHGAGFLKADAVAFSAGNTIEDLRPGERGANITEGRTAAAIVGQSAFATAQSVGYGSPLLTGFNQLAAAAFVQFGASRTVVTQDGTTVTDSVAVTAIGVASAITGQGALATKSRVGGGDFDVFYGPNGGRMELNGSGIKIFASNGRLGAQLLI